jgi:hypothetical protein
VEGSYLYDPSTGIYGASASSRIIPRSTARINYC